MFRYLPKVISNRYLLSVSRLSSASSPLFSTTPETPIVKTQSDESDQPSIIISDNCAHRLKQVVDNDEFLRIQVEGGGCQGFSYKFELDNKINDDDHIFQKDGSSIVVDKTSLEYINGSIVDYSSDKVKLEWRPLEDPTGLKHVNYYLKLSKFRLTSLVVLTTLAGYTMGCPSFDPIVATASLVGTGLVSAAAASLNQFLEIPFDSQMMRTRNRPLVLGQLSSGRAFSFSLISGTIGLTTLATFVNPLTAALGAFNLVLYSFVYTPMKRANIANTWVGSIVGAIPPVMGYTAAANIIDLPSILLGLILYSWQFPHFNALSWNIRHDYARAGYRMMSVTNEKLCVKTALRHAYLVTAYSCLMSAPFVGLTNNAFLVGSLPINIYLIYLSYKFYQNPNASTSRKLFRYSLIHLPALIILMLITKSTKSTKPQQILTPKEKLLT